jgi:hypothetical protein
MTVALGGYAVQTDLWPGSKGLRVIVYYLSCCPQEYIEVSVVSIVN